MITAKVRRSVAAALLFVMCISLYSQDRCFNTFKKNSPLDVGVNRDIKYRISTGLCYHFNSSSIDIGYKNNLLTVITMTVNPFRATPRMKDEFYVGYTYNFAIGKKENFHIGATAGLGVTSSNLVGRLYIDRRLYRGLFLHGSTIQAGIAGINHLIGGIKVNI